MSNTNRKATNSPDASPNYFPNKFPRCSWRGKKETCKIRKPEEKIHRHTRAKYVCTWKNSRPRERSQKLLSSQSSLSLTHTLSCTDNFIFPFSFPFLPHRESKWTRNFSLLREKSLPRRKMLLLTEPWAFAVCDEERAAPLNRKRSIRFAGRVLRKTKI